MSNSTKLVVSWIRGCSVGSIGVTSILVDGPDDTYST